jgi:hypothetical protein
VLLLAAPAAVLAQVTADAPRAAAPTLQCQADSGTLIADGRTVVHCHAGLGTSSTMAPATTAPAELLRISTSDGLLLDAQGQPVFGGTLLLELHGGVADFALLAPATAGDVRLRAEHDGEAGVQTLSFQPDLRDMVATGIVEVIVGRHGTHTGSSATSGFNDSPEQQIRSWSRQFGSDLYGAGRVAGFARGHVFSDTLLTVAYDSDKLPRQKLAATVDPNAVFPVTGDGSIVGFEAQSADRLYLRLDRQRDWLLYGDFTTAGTSTPLSPATRTSATAIEPMLLGRYNRTATGLRGHYESGGVVGDSFVIDDSLRQLVEEYPANGTSGPFAVRNNDAVQNSERVEVLVRDKNQRAVITSITPLLRFVDYSFEPFSGRILLNSPLPSLTPDGDPVSLKISYDVDQGGSHFLTYGLSGSAQATDRLRLGASDVEDRNPLADYALRSVSAELRPNDALQLVAEAAQTHSTLYTANGLVYAQASGIAGETGSSGTGWAERIEGRYQQGGNAARLWWLRSDDQFNNASSGQVPGREDLGLRASRMLGTKAQGYGEYLSSEDLMARLGRSSGRLGVNDRVSEHVKLDFSLGVLHDNAGFPSSTLIAPNADAPGAGGGVAGGFFGTGTSNSVIDPLTGMPINTLAATGSVATPGVDRPLDATTVRLGAQWQATEKLLVDGSFEPAIDGENRHRALLGLGYALTPADRVYARAESQTGLAPADSLNPAEHSNTFTAGMTRALSSDTRLFSEYRLVDAVSTTAPLVNDQLLALGVRNTHLLRPGLDLDSTLEHLRVLSGAQRQAFAIGTGVNYRANPHWQGSARLEFRSLSDDHGAPGNQHQDQWLSTLTAARRLDCDWTLLLKNYLLLQFNHDDAAGAALGNTLQERFLTGFAWRPIADNRINALASYEFKHVGDRSQLLGERYFAHIAATVIDYHPERRLWLTGRLAAKHRVDEIAANTTSSFDAWLVSGRGTYDLTQRVDVGVLLGTLRQTSGSAHESAYGLEAGFLVITDVWVSLGFNWSGYTDNDLAGGEYTQQGVYLRLRAKFDETRFRH